MKLADIVGTKFYPGMNRYNDNNHVVAIDMNPHMAEGPVYAHKGGLRTGGNIQYASMVSRRARRVEMIVADTYWGLAHQINYFFDKEDIFSDSNINAPMVRFIEAQGIHGGLVERARDFSTHIVGFKIGNQGALISNKGDEYVMSYDGSAVSFTLLPNGMVNFSDTGSHAEDTRSIPGRYVENVESMIAYIPSMIRERENLRALIYDRQDGPSFKEEMQKRILENL